jgi:hypothetical protein
MTAILVIPDDAQHRAGIHKHERTGFPSTGLRASSGRATAAAGNDTVEGTP